MSAIVGSNHWHEPWPWPQSGATLSRSGDRVFGCSRGPSAIVHERYRHFELSVNDERAVQAMADAIRASHGGLDVLINNAGSRP